MGQGLFVKSAKSSSPLDMKDEEEFEGFKTIHTILFYTILYTLRCCSILK